MMPNDSSGWMLAVTSIENFILINAVLSVISFSFAAYLRRHMHSWHPRTRARLYAASLILPPVLSAWLVCASLLPAMWLGAIRWQEEHEPSHSLHLLNAFTIPFDPALGYLTLGFMIFAAIIAIYAAVTAYFRVGRVIQQLEMGAVPASPEQITTVSETCGKYGVSVGLVVSNYPFTFVWGYLHSKLVVSTGLLNALSSTELAGVLAHETAHHARRDNLAKLALTICRYLSPLFPLTRLLYRWWSEQVEMICDEIAARRTSPMDLASALVRLKRLTLSAAPLSLRPAASGLFGEGKETFEQRVERMLWLAEQPEKATTERLAHSCVRVALTTGGVFILSLLALFAISPLVIHRVFEIILRVI
ncbi:MAG: M56 family metallopeptidase [Blastocatellia bacterium]|nr:M56 family metallopeptidase [Blastocatellia bacterium]